MRISLHLRRRPLGLYLRIGHPIYHWHESRWFAIAIGQRHALPAEYLRRLRQMPRS